MERHHFADHDPYSQSYGFPVVMFGCESWTIKKAECQRIDAFKLWCWRRLLRVPCKAGRSNQSILKEISLEYSLDGLMLKLQYFGHLMWSADSLEKTLKLGKIECRRRRGRQSMRWLDDIADSMDMSLSNLREMVKDRKAWHVTVGGVTKSRTYWATKQQQSPMLLSKFTDWIKDLLSMALPIRTRPSSPPQSVPSGSFHKHLILFHQRADSLKVTKN